MGRYDSPGRGDCKPQAKGEGGRVGSEGSGIDGALVSDLEERLRVADSRVRQLEGMVENEKARRMGLRQMLVGSQSSRRRMQGF